MKRLSKSIFSLNPATITISLSIIIAVLFFIGIPIFDLVEMKTYDLRFLWRGVEKPTSEVVMAVIDEKSLDTEGRWPWPRSKMARLIDLLSEDGAKVIGFDIGFLEPDENTNLQFIDQFDKIVDSYQVKSNPLKEFIKQSRVTADYDLTLAKAIDDSKAKVVLGYFFHMSQAALEYTIDQKEIENQLKRISDSKYPLVIFSDQNVVIDPFFRAYAPESNLEILTRAATSSGYFNMFPDADGVVRLMPLIIKCGEEGYMPLSIRSIWEYLDRPQTLIKVASYGIEGVQIGDKFIPTDENGQVRINYLGPGRTFPHYSIGDILHGKLPKGTFKDKVVLVGATAIGIYDLRNTPFDPIYPGLEIHATVIDNILNGRFLHKPKWTSVYDLFAVLFLGLLTGFVLSKTTPVKGLLFAAVLFFLHIIASRWLFVHKGVWVNMVYPLLAIAVIYVALSVYHYMVEEKNKRFLRATFSSYLSPELIEQMVERETMPELGGEARIVTAYFTDIQSFSTFSEILTAHQLVELLNGYLTVMTDILIAEGGTLDKYEGDAIVAFLGAPLDLPDHSIRACRVAVGMQNALLELRNKWRSEKQLPGEANRNIKNLSQDMWVPGDKWPIFVHGMKMRIGINTGEIVVGNMGSNMRMNYTMMGDAVNLAARLEAGAKQFGIYSAVSEHTMETEYLDEKGQQRKVMDTVEARFIDRITVVGKTEPVKIYELCAMKGGLTKQEEDLFKIFDKGMRHYQRMEWDTAIDYFKESLNMERIPDGNTTPSEVFIKRCEEFKENPPVPPGEKWDGAYRMTKK
ncbi:MAG: adenylate/guanylate cyclase domain-containing protein [Pseudomonadota bacterium]